MDLIHMAGGYWGWAILMAVVVVAIIVPLRMYYDGKWKKEHSAP
jgi:uncharacterized membrane protein